MIKTAGGAAEKRIKTSAIGVIGRHNLSNAAAAAALCHYGFGVAPEKIAETLKSFRGVHHRLEFVEEIGGVKFYNDSKATNEDSTKVALASFSGPVALIAGGSEKGSDYSGLSADVLRSSVRKVFVLGQVREKIKDALGRSGFADVVVCDTLEECVAGAFAAATPGWTVLLSPAFASLDMF
jgi:UDP-N-acetylmuramoylalanine--D-glutamate ligase